MDESGPNPAKFKELCSATDLAKRATKATAQAIGRAMASLVPLMASLVLECHLWLNLTEIKDADRTALLDFRLTARSVQLCGGWLCAALHRSTEVIAGYPSFPA